MAKYLNVGLTGAIACGKSLALNIFKALGCPTMDADQIYHHLVEPGQPLLKKIVKNFGDQVLNSQGSLDRDTLRQIVFNDAAAREKLNKLAHPAVIKEQNGQRKAIIRDLKRKQITEAVIVTDAALMIESGNYKSYNKVVVVVSNPDVQLQRLREREEISEEEARNRIAAQMSSEEKADFADYIIDNNGTTQELIRNVETTLSQLFDVIHK